MSVHPSLTGQVNVRGNYNSLFSLPLSSFFFFLTTTHLLVFTLEDYVPGGGRDGGAQKL